MNQTLTRESYSYIQTPEELLQVLENQIKPYYLLSKTPRFALDAETYSFFDKENEELYNIPRPIKLASPRGVCNIQTKQEVFMDYEGFVATLQLGADPRVCNMQWVFDIKKLGTEIITKNFKEILENSFILGHNIKYDTGFLITQFDIWLDPEKTRDTQIIDQILISGRKDHTGLSDNYRRYLDYGFFVGETGVSFSDYDRKKEEMQLSDWLGHPDQEQIKYAAEDVKLIHHVYENQKEEIKKFLKRNPSSGILNIIKLECSIITDVALMELRGVRFDIEYHNREVIPYLEQKCQEAYAKAVAFCPNVNKSKTVGRGALKRTFIPEINFGSAPQVKEILARLGVKVADTTEDTLKSARSQHPAVEHILRYRKAKNLLNNFGYKLPRFVHEDGKIYPNFRQIGTETGRFSGNKPNMQQIPSKEKLFGEINSGTLFRKAFIADLYHIIVDGDLSNIEPRIIAQVTRCIELIKAFVNKVDYHGFTAKILLDLAEIPAKKTPEREVIGKIGNLSLGYCAGWPRLKENMYLHTLDDPVPIQWTDEEAKEKHEKYFSYLPEVKIKIDLVRKMVESAFASHETLADFAGRRPLFTIHTEKYKRHRNFFLTEKQEGMAKHKAVGDPRSHPLHKWHELMREYPVLGPDGKQIIDIDPVTKEEIPRVTYKKSYYNEFNKTINNIAREAYNYLIQGEAANILKVSLQGMNYKKLREMGFDVFKEGPILSVHDEWVFQAHESRRELAVKLVKDSLEDAGRTVIKDLPVLADVGSNLNWALAKN